MKEIPVSEGFVAKVDDEDFPLLSRHKWNIKKGLRTQYAITSIQNRPIYMHRLIVIPTGILMVDHIDHNGLNNQKANLRICSRSQNSCNQVMSRSNKSGYRGVFWHEQYKRWRAVIVLNYKQIHLGSFKDKESAHLAYKEAAKKYYGAFAPDDSHLTSIKSFINSKE